MFLKNKTDWNLLAKFMAGETGEKETQAVSEWLDSSAENRVLYNRIKSDWKLMDTMKTQFNVDNAWNKLHDRIATNERSAMISDSPATRVQSRRYFLTPLRVAASLLLILCWEHRKLFMQLRFIMILITADSERGRG
jgi:hypothetical protein